MSDKKTFNAIYAEKLYPLLEELEKKRIVAERKVVAFRIAVVLVMVGLMILTSDNGAIVFIIFFVGMLVFSAGRILMAYDYIQEFKEQVIHPLVVGINETFIYRATQAIPRFVFNKSRLFGYYTDYRGDDLIKGNFEEVDFMFSELHVHEKRSNGKQTVIIDVFQGIFAEFDFNKAFESTLLIYPDSAEKYFGNLGKWLQSMNFTKDDLVYLDNPEFEKHFVVYGNDPVEARYLLTHTMMDYILKLRMKLNVPLYISFSDSKFYIAMEYGSREHFEPELSTSLFKQARLRKYFQHIDNIMDIITTFKLNQFLWSKPSPKELRIIEESILKDEPKLAPLASTPVSTETIKTRVDTDKEVFNAYYKKVKALLNPLERKRYLTFFLQIVFVGVVASIYLPILLYTNEHGTSKESGSIMGVGVLVLFGILYGLSYIANGYVYRYKTELIKSLVTFLNPELDYTPYRQVTQDEVYKSHLFRDWDNFYGGDSFEGNIAGLKVKASELNIEENDNTIFKGYLFIVDLKIAKRGQFRCFPEGYEYDVEVSQYIKEWPHLSTFSKAYMQFNLRVYKDAKQEASLFTQQFVKNLLSIKQELEIDKIFISHQDNKLYLGFDFNERSLFDAKVLTSVHNDKDIEFFISFYKGVEHLIKGIKIQ